jgi:hypothetical protein
MVARTYVRAREKEGGAFAPRRAAGIDKHLNEAQCDSWLSLRLVERVPNSRQCGLRRPLDETVIGG